MSGTRKRTQTYYYRNNTGGSNMRSNEANVNQGLQGTEMVLIQNMDIFREGGFQGQGGNVQLNTSITDATAILGIGQYRTSAGTFFVYVKASGNAYVLPIAGGIEGAPIKTGLSTTATPKFVEYNSKVIAFNGVDPPWGWNGTIAADLTGTPAAWSTNKPVTAAIDGGKRIFAAVNTATGFTIYYCALGNENDWTTASDAGSFSNVFNDSTAVTNLSNYGSNVAIHTSKPAIYLMTGTQPSNYSVNPMASNRAATGINAASTVQDYQYFYSGDSILPIITTELGVIKLGKQFDISQKIKPFLTGGDTELPINPVDPADNANVILLPYDTRNQLIAYFRTQGSSNFDTAAIFNMDTNAWVFRKATRLTTASRVGDYIITGTPGGLILREFTGVTVAGDTYIKRLMMPCFDFGVPNNDKQLIRFYIVFKANTNLNLTLKIYTDYNSSPAYQTPITTTDIILNTYGTGIYGTSTYASTQLMDIELGPINLQAKRFQVEIASNDSVTDFRIIYYAFEVEMLDAH